MKQDLTKIINVFDFQGENVSYERLFRGHINETYVVTNKIDSDIIRYIIQRVNTTIFHDPVGLMKNIKGITEFIRNTITAQGGDVQRCTLDIIPVKGGGFYYIDDEGGFWRAYSYIENSVSYDIVSDINLMYKAGVALGDFQKILAEYPADTLSETIVDFHNTVSRYTNFEKAVESNLSGRRDNVLEEIKFVRERKNICSVLIDKIREGSIPIRVTHNDTKINNILMDDKTNDVLCFIDLDTVMPGSALYDFGDSIRFAASSGAEDERDLDKIWMRIDYYKAYAQGYLSVMSKELTREEIELIPESCILLTLECGMRFLTDYINGDVYFGIHYPEHNLDRARTQFKLVEDMENKFDEMKSIISSICKQSTQTY